MNMSEQTLPVLSGRGKVFWRVNNYRKTDTLCDIKLLVDKKVFPAHKAILAGFSPYFEAMFVRDFAEAEQDTITLDCIDVNIVESLLQYAYTDEITITTENVAPLLHAASYLQLPELFDGTSMFLEQNLSADNCVDALNLADAYSCQHLKESAKKFALLHFFKVSLSVGFLELDAEKVIGIIDDNALVACKEEYVFDAVMRWFHYNEERRADLAKVLRHVRLAHLDPSFLHSRVRTIKALTNTESVAKLMEEVMWYHLLPKQRNEVHRSFTKRRHTSSDVEVFLALGKNSSSNVLLFYVSEEGTFIKEMPGPSTMNPSWSACNYQMHALFAGDKQSVIVFNHEAPQKPWTALFQLHRPQLEGRPLLVNVDGHWFSFGDSSAGKDNGPYKYDSETQVWIKIASPPESILNGDVLSLHGMIYAVGEMKGSSTNRIQRYDPLANTWTQITSLPVSRKKPRVCGFNRCIYVFSECFSEEKDVDARRVDVYDISTDEWRRCADIPYRMHPSYLTGPTVLGGRIYVLTQTSATTSEVQVYCPISDAWKEFKTMLPGELKLVGLLGALLIPRPK